jgi:PTS system galactitol-specific IIB component
MTPVRILVVCGSGVATSMNVSYKMKEYFQKEKLPVSIDGAGINELDGRMHAYDIIVSNAAIHRKIDKPVFSAIPLLTGIGERELMEKIIKQVRFVMENKSKKL